MDQPWPVVTIMLWWLHVARLHRECKTSRWEYNCGLPSRAISKSEKMPERMMGEPIVRQSEIRMEASNHESNGRLAMRQLPTRLCTFAVLFLLISFSRSLQAQTRVPAHDVTQEVTLTGTVSSVLMNAAPGAIAGSHLLLVTPAGPVDASLGRFGLKGNGALSVAAGEQIEATGVMKMIHDKPILLVRAVKVSSGDVYTIRTEHGFPVSPKARERAAKNTGRTELSR